MAAQLGASAGLALMEGKGGGKGLPDMAMIMGAAGKGGGKGGKGAAGPGAGAGGGGGGGGEVTAYYAPWCGFSKKLVSQVEENKADLDSKNISVNLIDCTQEGNKTVCDAANVSGYPHLTNGCGQEKPGYIPHEQFCQFATCNLQQ